MAERGTDTAPVFYLRDTGKARIENICAKRDIDILPINLSDFGGEFYHLIGEPEAVQDFLTANREEFDGEVTSILPSELPWRPIGLPRCFIGAHVALGSWVHRYLL